MAYKVLIKKEAQKTLLALPTKVRTRIVEKIVVLGRDPNDNSLDIKPLAGSVFYRLRLGSWRIIFDRRDTIKLIAIEKIGMRGDVYK